MVLRKSLLTHRKHLQKYWHPFSGIKRNYTMK